MDNPNQRRAFAVLSKIAPRYEGDQYIYLVHYSKDGSEPATTHCHTARAARSWFNGWLTGSGLQFDPFMTFDFARDFDEEMPKSV